MQIIEYTPELGHHFDRINRDWIEKYFVIEDRDDVILKNPEEQIINNGGAILFVSENDQILGTVVLLKHTNKLVELTKMGVYEIARNKGTGKLLIESANKKAKQLGFKTIMLHSNRKLKNAIHLYEKCGFKEMEIDENDYARCDIQMERSLSDVMI